MITITARPVHNSGSLCGGRFQNQTLVVQAPTALVALLDCAN